MRNRNHQKVISTNIYRRMIKYKELEKETFDKVIENLPLSGTIFTKTDPELFYIPNDNIIIKCFNDVTLLPHGINGKENKINDLNHRFEILSEVSELKLNDINNQITSITSIYTALNNITSSHKAKNDCPKISYNQDIDEIKFLREELKNNNTIINILLENTFSKNKDFSSYKKLEDNYKNNVEKNQFKTPKRYSFEIANHHGK